MKLSKYLIYVLAILLFYSCSIGKRLDRPAYVKIDNNCFKTEFDLSSEKYVDIEFSNNYIQDFEEELKEVFSTYNIHVLSSLQDVNDPKDAYILSLDNLLISETYEMESVYVDATSEFAETFNVVSCNVKTKCRLYMIDSHGDKFLLNDLISSVGKDEKLSNNRTFFQIIFGLNKDNTEYTYKELDDDVINRLCKRAARRIAGKISRKIFKNQ